MGLLVVVLYIAHSQHFDYLFIDCIYELLYSPYFVYVTICASGILSCIILCSPQDQIDQEINVNQIDTNNSNNPNITIANNNNTAVIDSSIIVEDVCSSATVMIEILPDVDNSYSNNNNSNDNKGINNNDTSSCNNHSNMNNTTAANTITNDSDTSNTTIDFDTLNRNETLHQADTDDTTTTTSTTGIATI